MLRLACALLLLVLIVSAGAAPVRPPAPSGATTFYVAPGGNDRWSGKLPDPNNAKTDGPFATLTRARDAVREARKQHPGGSFRVLLRGGTYHLTEPLPLGPEDSGTPERPVVWAAYPNEKPVLSGGRPITGFRKGADDVYTADIPDVQSGKWYFRRLRVGSEMQTRARYPNADPKDPVGGGWLFIVEAPNRLGAFGKKVGNIHTPGDFIEWKVQVPADGDYRLWMFYGAYNKPFGRDNMAGRTTFTVDGGAPAPLENLPDTGGWDAIKWSDCATLPLKAGERTLRWTNKLGGGLNFDAFALSDDPAWRPAGTQLAAPAAGKHALVVQAEAFSEAKGKEMRVEAAASTKFFSYKPGDWKPWPKSPEPEIHIFPAWGWVNAIIQVDQVDHEKRVVHVKGGNAQQELRVGNRYYVDNVLEELDTPGEWHLDRASGTLHYLPKEPGFEAKGVVAPVIDRLIEIAGDAENGQPAGHIRIQGLTFTDTAYSPEIPSLYLPQDAAVWLRGARGCVIEGCTFTNIGGYGVCLQGAAEANEVVGNTIAQAGQGGVLLLGASKDAAGASGTAADPQPRKNLIAANTIHHCGTVYKHVAGVYVPLGGGNTIAHNLIHDVPRYAISLKTGSHGNIVEYNDIHHTNLETNDTGAIETLGRDRQLTGNVIRFNRILDAVGFGTTPSGEILRPHYTWGIYLDDYSSGTTIYGNIVARNVRGGAHVHGGMENVIENNIFVDSAMAQVEFNNIGSFMVRNRCVRNILCFSGAESVLIRSGGWKGDVLAECNRNLFWSTGGEDLQTSERSLTPEGTLAKWRLSGRDSDSVVADPLFVDPAKDDYRLREGSPALKLGFKPIPVEKIGPGGFVRK